MLKTVKLFIFILINLFWFVILSGIIYTLCSAPIAILIPDTLYPITKSFISLPFILIMTLVLFSNIVFFKAKEEDLNISRKIILYITSLLPISLIVWAWFTNSGMYWPGIYINYFGMFQVGIYGYANWIPLMIIGVLCLLSFLNIYSKYIKGELTK